ncbi:MAG: hypothetical protein RL373_37 [Pseudomonadota bacterium]|jgi:hypothetical protein
MKDYEMHWLTEAKEQLLGRKIVDVRYMSQEEADDLDWTERPVVFHLDDGNLIFASADDEGNNGGALFTNNQANPVLPVLR